MATVKPLFTRPATPTARPTPRPETLPAALAMLAKDHKDANRLFRQFEALTEAAAEPDERGDLARLICAALVMHAALEEELFYPALRSALASNDVLDEAAVEHTVAKDLVAQIEAMDPADALYDAKVIVLGEYVAHHVREEEGELFPMAQKSGLELAALGERMHARKEQLIAGGAGTVTAPAGRQRPARDPQPSRRPR